MSSQRGTKDPRNSKRNVISSSLRSLKQDLFQILKSCHFATIIEETNWDLRLKIGPSDVSVCGTRENPPSVLLVCFSILLGQ